jgi:hypothetical protein
MILYADNGSGASSAGFVMEMNWRVLITAGDTTAQALKIAREAKSTHYIHGKNEKFVGSIRLPKQNKNSSPVSQYALAYVAAKAYPNSAWLLNLPDSDLIWACLCNGGAPVAGSDRLMAIDEVHSFVENNRVFIEELKPKGGEFFSSIDVAGKTHEMSFADLIGMTSEEALLSKLDKGSFVALRNIPRKYWVFAGVAIAAVLGQRYYSQWEEAQRIIQSKLEKASNAEANDPALLFKKALDAWRLEQGAPSHTALMTLQATLFKMPVKIGSWSFKRVDCTSVVKNKTALWGCSANYVRDSYPAQSNNDFASLAPKDWVLSWSPLNEVKAKFSVPFEYVPITDAVMRTRVQHQTDTISKYQLIDKAFSNAQLLAFGPIVLPQIKKPDGTAFVPPIDMIGQYGKAEFSITAPLRSIDIFPLDENGVAWTAVSVTVAQDARPSLTTSRLTMTAKGSLYAKN